MGCGTGALTIWAARLGAKVLAIDSSSEMLRLCAGKARGLGIAEHVSAICRDAHDLSILEDSRFDCVVSCFSATQFSSRSAVYREMFRVLGKNGRCVVTCWDEPSQMKLFQALLGALSSVVPNLSSHLTAQSGRDSHLMSRRQRGGDAKRRSHLIF